MAIVLSQVRTPTSFSHAQIIKSAMKQLYIYDSDVKLSGIQKMSLDARHNDNIKFVSSVYFELFDAKREKALAEKFKSCNLIETEKIEEIPSGEENLNGKVIVVGFGPCGMFAALTLAKRGFKPIVIERGAEISERVSAVNSFWNGGKLSETTNVQFGEGGAGTFSDGKLTTRIKDPYCKSVLETFCDFGAPNDILFKAKPHIGTDNLRKIVKSIREEIIELGGEVHFNTKLTDINFKAGNICSVTVNNTEEIECGALVLAIGHSARDTFEMLLKKDVFIEPKAFSVGARIEHTKTDIAKSLYGTQFNNPNLPVGEYNLSFRSGERAAYTFCMCPGGVVVPSQSEENTIVTNGMSEYSRAKENSNSALVVSVSPSDFGNSPLDGVDFARKIEQNAFNIAGKDYKAPCMSVAAFKTNGKSKLSGKITPSYKIGVKEVDFRQIFPKFVTDMMVLGLNEFSKKMFCFGNGDAVLTAPETRTSSPIRITRNDIYASVSCENLYPCGEGAGYAGGIMSSAVDGIRVANEIIATYACK